MVIVEWNQQGLPTDQVSTDNALTIENCGRFPLLIDPQGIFLSTLSIVLSMLFWFCHCSEQGKRWLKKALAQASLRVAKFPRPPVDPDPKKLEDFAKEMQRFQGLLEKAISTGTPVLIEDCGESLDPCIDPLLLHKQYPFGGRWLIRFNDQEITYERTFKLYITTKLPNPHFVPEIWIKTTVINFTVTRKGLEEQLLARVVEKEKSSLEESRKQLVKSMSVDKKTLKKTEKDILDLLNKGVGDILDDPERKLIRTLTDAKNTAAMISNKLQESEVNEKGSLFPVVSLLSSIPSFSSLRLPEINNARDKYRPVAQRSSILYFVNADLAGIDSMYQFSLPFFQILFLNAMDHTEPGRNLKQRIQNFIDTITYAIFTNTCRGLFESHKLLYSFLIAAEILRSEGLSVCFHLFRSFLLHSGCL